MASSSFSKSRSSTRATSSDQAIGAIYIPPSLFRVGAETGESAWTLPSFTAGLASPQEEASRDHDESVTKRDVGDILSQALSVIASSTDSMDGDDSGHFVAPEQLSFSSCSSQASIFKNGRSTTIAQRHATQ